MDKLGPCPFCGGSAVFARETHVPTEQVITSFSGEFTVARPSVNDGWLAECGRCGARGPHGYTKPIQSMETAAAAWNRRTAGA